MILLHVLLPLLEQVALGDFDKTARYSLPEYLQSFERVAMKRLKAAVPPHARAWCTPEERVASGKPYRAIIQVAEETGADLIVMGVHDEKRAISATRARSPATLRVPAPRLRAPGRFGPGRPER